MQPGDVEYVIVKVVTSAGVAVTGLVTGDFTVSYWLNATTPVAVFTATGLGSGLYRIALTTPGTAGFWTVVIEAAGYTVQNGRYHGELEEQDLDSVFAVVVRPLSQLAGMSQLASEVTLSVNGRRYKELSVAVVDQNGDPIDLSGYNNWRFSVWDRAHTGSVYTLSSGITGSALGIVAWSIPEDAAFYSFLDTAILAGDNQVTLFYDMIADKAATASKTEAVFRGQLIAYRWEGTA